MEMIRIPLKNKRIILALGAESAGIFAFYRKGAIFVSENFGDLLDDDKFLKYKKAVLEYLRKEKIVPDIVLTDRHPLYKTTIFGEEIVKMYKIRNIKVQHHIAHIFSAVGDRLLQDKAYGSTADFIGIAMDGTGYGLDGNIWGGEAFWIQISNLKIQSTRIGSLEEQIMIGGDLAVKEPARILIAILSKILTKNEVYSYIKKYYSKNEFEVLYNQMKQDFNCQTATSTGRVLDAAAVLLGFAGNERKYKHEAVKKLEKNSTVPYTDIEPLIEGFESREILNVVHLFDYLIKNIRKDKKRLAATAQLYIARGFFAMIKELWSKNCEPGNVFAAGGMCNNKIISAHLEKQGAYLSKKIPRGDEGIAFGQIIYYLLNKL